MRQRSVTVTRHTAASSSEVWELLADVTTWPDWAPVRGTTLERPGDVEPQGVGAVRSLRRATGTTREEIVAFDAPNHVGYVLLSGLPVQDYRSDVTLQARSDGGTTITWSSTFRSNWLWHRVVTLAIHTFTRRLATAAGKRTLDHTAT